MMKTDITNRHDIHLLVSVFYQKLLADESISYLFTDVAKIKLEEHLDVLVDFWETILLNTGSYQKNVMALHLKLHQQSPLQPYHFKTWLSFFHASVNELFDGPNAEMARQRATGIATVMQIKIAELQKDEI